MKFFFSWKKDFTSERSAACSCFYLFHVKLYRLCFLRDVTLIVLIVVKLRNLLIN